MEKINIMADASKFSIAGIRVLADVERSRQVADLLDPWADRLEHRCTASPRVQTGLPSVDELLGGVQAGEVAIIAGRPGAGADTLLFDVVRYVTRTCNSPGLLVSLVVPAIDAAERLIAPLTDIPLSRLRAGGLQDEQWERVAKSMGGLDGAPLWINPAPVHSLGTVWSEVERLNAEATADKRSPLALLAIDGLHQLVPDGASEGIYEDLAAIARGLKSMARATNIAVVVRAPLNRGPETRAAKNPMLFDLRGAGDLEDVADHVLLIHREGMYDRESPWGDQTKIILAKNPHLPYARTVLVDYHAHTRSFTEIEFTDIGSASEKEQSARCGRPTAKGKPALHK